MIGSSSSGMRSHLSAVDRPIPSTCQLPLTMLPATYIPCSILSPSFLFLIVFRSCFITDPSVKSKKHRGGDDCQLPIEISRAGPWLAGGHFNLCRPALAGTCATPWRNRNRNPSQHRTSWATCTVRPAWQSSRILLQRNMSAESIGRPPMLSPPSSPLNTKMQVPTSSATWAIPSRTLASKYVPSTQRLISQMT